MASKPARISKPSLKVAVSKYEFYHKNFFTVLESIDVNDVTSIESKIEDLEDIYSLYMSWYEKLYICYSESGQTNRSQLILAESEVVQKSYQHVHEKVSPT